MICEDSKGKNQHANPPCKRNRLAWTRVIFCSIQKDSPAIVFLYMDLIEGAVGFNLLVCIGVDSDTSSC